MTFCVTSPGVVSLVIFCHLQVIACCVGGAVGGSTFSGRDYISKKSDQHSTDYVHHQPATMQILDNQTSVETQPLLDTQLLEDTQPIQDSQPLVNIHQLGNDTQQLVDTQPLAHNQTLVESQSQEYIQLQKSNQSVQNTLLLVDNQTLANSQSLVHAHLEDRETHADINVQSNTLLVIVTSPQPDIPLLFDNQTTIDTDLLLHNQSQTSNQSQLYTQPIRDTYPQLDTQTQPSTKHAADFQPLLPSQSCQDKCGKRGYGCDCDQKCVVFKNCCEDFYLHCEKTVQEDIQNFYHKLPIETQCVKENIFLITSCPQNSSTTFKDVIPRNMSTFDFVGQMCWRYAVEIYETLTARSFYGVSNLTQTSEEYDHLSVILEAISKTYITDRSTGLVYKDLSVFACYATEISTPCVWQLFVESSPSKPLGYLKNNEVFSFFNIPPKRQLIAKRSSLCHFNALDKCDENSEFFSKKLSEKCHSFTSVVHHGMTVYKNRYCLQCYSQDHQYHTIKQSPYVGRDVISSVLMSVKSTTIHLNTVSESNNKEWATAKCFLQRNVPCEIITCNEGSVKRSNGMCMTRYTLHIGLQVNVTSLNRVHHQLIAQLLRCSARKFLGWDFDEDSSLTEYHLDEHLVLYGVVLGFYLHQQNLGFTEIQKFSYEYGNSIYKTINNVGLSRHGLGMVYFKGKFARERKGTVMYNTLVLKNTVFKNYPRNVFEFCVGIGYQEDGRNASLSCYPRPEIDVSQNNDSCIEEYFLGNLSTSTASRFTLQSFASISLLLYIKWLS